MESVSSLDLLGPVAGTGALILVLWRQLTSERTWRELISQLRGDVTNVRAELIAAKAGLAACEARDIEKARIVARLEGEVIDLRRQLHRWVLEKGFEHE